MSKATLRPPVEAPYSARKEEIPKLGNLENVTRAKSRWIDALGMLARTRLESPLARAIRAGALELPPQAEGLLNTRAFLVPLPPPTANLSFSQVPPYNLRDAFAEGTPADAVTDLGREGNSRVPVARMVVHAVDGLISVTAANGNPELTNVPYFEPQFAFFGDLLSSNEATATLRHTRLLPPPANVPAQPIDLTVTTHFTAGVREEDDPPIELHPEAVGFSTGGGRLVMILGTASLYLEATGPSQSVSTQVPTWDNFIYASMFGDTIVELTEWKHRFDLSGRLVIPSDTDTIATRVDIALYALRLGYPDDPKHYGFAGANFVAPGERLSRFIGTAAVDRSIRMDSIDMTLRGMRRPSTV